MYNPLDFFDRLWNDDGVREGLILGGRLIKKSSVKNIESQSV